MNDIFNPFSFNQQYPTYSGSYYGNKPAQTFSPGIYGENNYGIGYNESQQITKPDTAKFDLSKVSGLLASGMGTYASQRANKDDLNIDEMAGLKGWASGAASGGLVGGFFGALGGVVGEISRTNKALKNLDTSVDATVTTVNGVPVYNTNAVNKSLALQTQLKNLNFVKRPSLGSKLFGLNRKAREAQKRARRNLVGAQSNFSSANLGYSQEQASERAYRNAQLELTNNLYTLPTQYSYV